MPIDSPDRSGFIRAHQAADLCLCDHRAGDPSASGRLIAICFTLLEVVGQAADAAPFGTPGEAVAYDPAMHLVLDGSKPRAGQPVFVKTRGFVDAYDETGPTPLPPVLAKAGVQMTHPYEANQTSDQPWTLMDVRVPQPGREAEYGVPHWATVCAGLLYSLRNEVPDQFVAPLDQIILALYRPWIRKSE